MTYPLSLTRILISLPLIAMFLVASTGLVHADIHVAFKADYDAEIKGFAVKASRKLKPLGQDRFELSFRATSWAAKLNETSVFSWQDQEIQPQEYLYNQSAFGKKKQRSASFDLQTQQILSTDGENSKTLPLKETIFDPLNYQLQLQLDIAANKQNLTYPIVKRGELRQYRFEILGDERLNTKAGELNTVKVKVIRGAAAQGKAGKI